jgi:hypothetical protein
MKSIQDHEPAIVSTSRENDSQSSHVWDWRLINMKEDPSWFFNVPFPCNEEWR